MSIRKTTLAALLGAVFMAAPGFAQQNYPEKPIKVIVPIAPGSLTDIIMRVLERDLQPRLGQSLVIENKAGASGILGAQACASAAPDGYTLCLVYHSTLSFNPLLFNKLPYDAEKDFALVTRLFFLIEGLAVSTASKVNSVAELKAQALARPEAFNFGTLGNGSFPELFLNWLNNQWKTKIPAVPFRGGGPIAQALSAGDLQIGNMGIGNFMPLVDGGTVKLLAVGAPERSPVAPTVPTFAEVGLGDYKGRGWWGLAAPAGTPRAIIDKLNTAFVAVLNDPKTRAFLDKQATIAAPTTPEEFAAFVRQDRLAAEALIKLASTPKEDFVPEPVK